MTRLVHQIRSWAQENKVWSSLIVGAFLGTLFLTGAPVWWEPAKTVWRWGTTPHGIPGWVLVLMAPGVLIGYAQGAVRLWHWWRPLPPPPAPSTKFARQAEVEPVVEEIEGVQWRCTLYDGEVYELTAHCPKCLIKIDPESNRSPRRGEATTYRCDGCRDFESQIEGRGFKVQDRITRLIEARWLQRQESRKAGRG